MIWRYFIAWFGMMILAIMNGGFRDLVYKQSIGNPAAHQISTFILLVLMSVYFWILTKVLPFESIKQAWVVGLMWFVMTEVFEFGMGAYSGNSWSELFQAYNIMAGQIWLLIPIWALIGPPIIYRYVQIK